MKRFISALVFCCSLLLLLGFILFPRAEAKVEPIRALLDQPAPPPPNPLVKLLGRTDEKFYDKSKPPADNASIDDLLDYWAMQSSRYSALSYNPKLSDAAADRVFAEISRNPEKLTNLLNSLPDGKRSADFVKEMYDREGKDGAFTVEDRATIKQWLTYNSPYFSSELTRAAEQVREDNEYVTNHEDLLALTSVDYDRAKPIIDRLYSNGSQKVPQVLAKWARYRNALLTNSASDIETYRNELKAVVEDKTATAGMRDLALDALSREKDWPERDEWYFSLLGDETLADLRVNGSSFTGLTTMLMMTPEDKYIAKMLELVKSDNLAIRSAAVRNLSLRMNTDNLDILRALVPWLDDPKWATDYASARSSYINSLSEHEIPESVPGLIKVLDEKAVVQVRYASNRAANYPAMAMNSNFASNSMANAANAAANAMRYAANAMSVAADMIADRPINRMGAVLALAKQKDQRATSALRRILSEVDLYERGTVVKAIVACNGFTIQEQLDGLESKAKGVRTEMEEEGLSQDAANSPVLYGNAIKPAVAAPMANNSPNDWNDVRSAMRRPITPAELRFLIGEELAQSQDISDELAIAVVDRIEAIDAKEPKMAAAYRRIVLNWKNSAIRILFLRDVKRGIADTDTMIRLITERKDLREKHSAEMGDLRTVRNTPAGFASCLFEDPRDNEAVIESDDMDAKAVLYACSRLIRLPLPVIKVAADLKSPNALLKLAAERYLESEDSPEARSFIYPLYPTEIKVLGARSAFLVDGKAASPSQYAAALFQSVGNESLYYGWFQSGNDSDLIEKERSLVDEMKKNAELANVYSYDGNYIRVYKDRAVFSWDEDAARYRERSLSKGEFEGFTEFLRFHNASDLPPFISCGGDYCSSKELLMLARTGGRRVYFSGSADFDTKRGGPEFPIGLNDYFVQLRKDPATLKYNISRELAGLEIIFASDDVHAETVWKGDGNDLRLAGSITSVRKKVQEDIDGLDEEDSLPGVAADYQAKARKKMEMIAKRRFEGFGWYKVANGGVEPGAAQPPQAELIPARDGQTVPPSDEQWKARSSDVEIRASETGLYKLVRGKLTRIRPGDYSIPVISADGRWVIVQKMNERMGNSLVRVDLVTNREVPLPIADYSFYKPSALVRSLNRVLIYPNYNEYQEYSDPSDDTVRDDPDAEQMQLVDLAAGTLHPAPRNVGVLAQQTFRPLQPTAKPNELWAAIPDMEKNETLVGTFNWKTFAFTQVLRIPKIRFNSMSMWVDEPANKVYFVYRGHLLAMPMGK